MNWEEFQKELKENFFQFQAILKHGKTLYLIDTESFTKIDSLHFIENRLLEW
jgi:hypothetical protein